MSDAACNYCMIGGFPIMRFLVPPPPTVKSYLLGMTHLSVKPFALYYIVLPVLFDLFVVLPASVCCSACRVLLPTVLLCCSCLEALSSHSLSF